MANKEEEKLQFAEFAKEAEEARKRVLTYEEYFQLDPTKDGHIEKQGKGSGSSKGDTTFEQYQEQNASPNLFDNELLEMQYKFWESQEDKMQRLKIIWLDLKRKNALGGLDQRTTKEQIELNQEVAEIIRRVRTRVDQEMVRRSIQPIFTDNYHSYTKDEFLYDADFEFVKVKNLLNKSPKLLKDDPLLSLDYLKIINLIKKKKLMEKTSD